MIDNERLSSERRDSASSEERRKNCRTILLVLEVYSVYIFVFLLAKYGTIYIYIWKKEERERVEFSSLNLSFSLYIHVIFM